MIFFGMSVNGEEITDYLIIKDIGGYKASKNPSAGRGSGVLSGAGHFIYDHQDINHRISYYDLGVRGGAKVQVTQHTGFDSDKWLLHELSRDFRNYFGLPGDSYVMRQINGVTLMATGSGGWAYRWLSGNKVIHIEYTDLQMTKPEPLEVVNAYLAMHPSTLISITSYDLRNDNNKTIWIKDEMSRQLWLCDKWFSYHESSGTDIAKTIREVVSHLGDFLDYRERYYGINAKGDKRTLEKYMLSSNETGIKDQLVLYKQWWDVNKGKPINLP